MDLAIALEIALEIVLEIALEMDLEIALMIRTGTLWKVWGSNVMTRTSLMSRLKGSVASPNSLCHDKE